MGRAEHIAGHTFHNRRGAVRNRFRYGVDYILIDTEAPGPDGPALFSRNRANLVALHDVDHGGPPGAGRGAAWVREMLAREGRGTGWGRIRLLAQPRVAGHVFNPVSFWLVDGPDGALRMVVAEVTNTFGDRHCYLCHRDDMARIGAGDTLAARKLMHVSPFQDTGGRYSFRFDIARDRIAIRIEFRDGADGVVATLEGTRRMLSNRSILGACLRRPFGSRRVLALIHWQAFKLWWKGAGYRERPPPPDVDVSR